MKFLKLKANFYKIYSSKFQKKVNIVAKQRALAL